MADLKDLRDKRGKSIADARALIDKAENEKRELSEEEKTAYDKHMDDQLNLKGRIDSEVRLNEAERDALENASQEADKNKGLPNDGIDGDIQTRAMIAASHFIRTGRFVGEGVAEFRALQADADTEGGFLVMPEQFVNQLIKDIDDQTFIRNKATKYNLSNAQSLGVPTLDADPADADWTSELNTGSEDSTMTFGKRAMTPNPVAKRIKISNKLLMNSVMPAESLVRARLGYKFAITHEKAFLTGIGSGQPLGLFTASSDGIPTSRDISTGNDTTSIKFDGLIEAKYTLKGQYWGMSEWLFHRDALKQIAKLKDGEGQYIWRESVRDNEPDRLLGRPVSMSEYVPNTFTTGLYVGLLGMFSDYWIVDSIGTMQVQRLNELYAETNQVGFIGRLETDGAPVRSESFARVTLA